MISDGLQEKGCTVINAEGDADYDIVQAAIAASKYNTKLQLLLERIQIC